MELWTTNWPAPWTWDRARAHGRGWRGLRHESSVPASVPDAIMRCCFLARRNGAKRAEYRTCGPQSCTLAKATPALRERTEARADRRALRRKSPHDTGPSSTDRQHARTGVRCLTPALPRARTLVANHPVVKWREEAGRTRLREPGHPIYRAHPPPGRLSRQLTTARPRTTETPNAHLSLRSAAEEARPTPMGRTSTGAASPPAEAVAPGEQRWRWACRGSLLRATQRAKRRGGNGASPATCLTTQRPQGWTNAALPRARRSSAIAYTPRSWWDKAKVVLLPLRRSKCIIATDTHSPNRHL